MKREAPEGRRPDQRRDAAKRSESRKKRDDQRRKARSDKRSFCRVEVAYATEAKRYG